MLLQLWMVLYQILPLLLEGQSFPQDPGSLQVKHDGMIRSHEGIKRRNGVVVSTIRKSSSGAHSSSLGSCASIYAKKVSRLLTSDKSLKSNLGNLTGPAPTQQMLESYFLSRMALMAKAPQSGVSCPADLVINAAPGSSGTRSFFLATALMNLPSAHYRIGSAGNCSIVDVDTGVVSPARRVYSDTPFSNSWWLYVSNCPQLKTVFTAVDSEKWAVIRRRHKKRLVFRKWHNVIPIPFEPPDLPENIISLFSLHNSSVEVAAETYNLFKELVFCSTPRSRRMIIDYTKLASPAQFWGKLNSFLGAGLGESELQDLIAAGLPYWGHSKCFVGSPSRPCPDTLSNESRVSYKGLGLPGPCA